MSINLTTYAQLFETEVKQQFQEKSVLRDTVRLRMAAKNSAVKFNLMGRGLAQARTNVQTPLPVMNVTHTQPVATVTDWTASELTDIFMNNKVSFDERQELVTSISSALGRRLDQIILAALAAGSYTGRTVANSIGGSNTNLNLTKLREIAKIMDKEGVDSADRFLVCHPNGLHAMLGDAQVTSADYNNIRALIQGDIDSYYGFKFRKIGDRDEGGLTIDGNSDRVQYAWQKSAVGLALNMDINIRIDWDSQYGAYRVTGFMSAGAVIIDPLGTVQITTRDTAAYSA